MVGRGASGGECYGTDTDGGAGYMNNCIHSGSSSGTSGDTVWYNYVVASAETIKNSGTSDTTGTTVIATESICPKGWALPSTKQINSIGSVNGGTGSSSGSSTYIPNFSPVLGGYYFNGILYNGSTHGVWWGSTAYNGMKRYGLGYNGSNSVLYTNSYGSYAGLYIRCVSEEKDVSDLTYMQDMTPSIASPPSFKNSV